MRTSKIRAALLLALGLFLVPATALGTPTKITILHVNDTHSHLDAIGPKDRNLDGTLGGIAKAATVIATLKATEPDALFVHAGDLFNGDAYFAAHISPGGPPALSVPEMQLLASLGLDVMTLGNHEFGLGTDALAAALYGAFQGAGPSVLTANIDPLVPAPLMALVQPWVVKEVGGVRVGFFGMTAIDFLSQGSPEKPTLVEPTLKIADAQATALRKQGADVVVFLSHLGFEMDKVVAANVPGIDAVIGGHDHLLLSQPVMVPGPGGKSVPVVQAGEHYKWVGKLTLAVENGQVSLAGYQLVPVDAGVPRLLPVAGAVRELQAGINQLYGEGEDLWHAPIALALIDVAKNAPEGSPLRDSPIGDLVTDALRAKGQTDIALTVNGFFTEGLTHGRLVPDDAFRIVGDGIDPFGGGLGFPLYEIRLDGQNLLAALETALVAGGDFFVQVSGMTYVFDSRKPAGSRLVGARVRGQPVDPARIYSATVNLGVLQGLAQFPSVTLAAEPRPLGVSEYVAVRDWMARLKLILYFSHGRAIDLGKIR
jgi:5'-nucleotidase